MTEGDAGTTTETKPEAAKPAEQSELEDRLKRALADLDNLRKRFSREVGRERQAEREHAAASWLPVVDNLELALQHGAAGADVLVNGVQAIRDQAVAILERLGYPRFEDIGSTFDPARHEAVGTLDPGDCGVPPNTVVAAVRPGYGAGEQILRPASVMVARPAPPATAPTDGPPAPGGAAGSTEQARSGDESRGSQA